MKQTRLCPVPRYQIPIEEFRRLSSSWFFAWPINKDVSLYKRLFVSWLIILPLTILISTGSLTLRNDIPKLIDVCLLLSLILPMILIARQFFGWSYILKRLLSEKVEYEESGWHDGKIWEKPINWRERDLLIAQHEVRPAINQLTNPMLIISLLMLISTIFYFQFPS